MQRLSGITASAGSGFGTSAVVRWMGGVAQIPARILEEMAAAARKGVSEPIDVVLVAEEYAPAAALSLPGVRVVGMVVETESLQGGMPGFPVLTGVSGATTRIPDDVLIIVDGDRGIAFVDPDGAIVAGYQAEQERIAPRRRIYIDHAHDPARTLDGRLVRVYGVAADEVALSAAAEAGADALVAFFGPASDGPESTDEDAAQFKRLTRFVRAAAGKPLTLVTDLEWLSVPALLRVSTLAEVTLAAPIPSGMESLREVREYLSEAGHELSAAEVEWRAVKVAALISPDDPTRDADEVGADRFVADLTGVWDPAGPDTREWLESWTLMAARFMAPVEVILPAGSLEAAGMMIALGAAAVGVGPSEIQPAKDLIRTTDADALRAAFPYE